MRILVIGCGSIGARHAQNAMHWAEVGVIDANPEAAASLQQQGAPLFSDLADALSWQPDGIVVATPHSSHVSIAMQCLTAGVPMLIEKPLSDSMQEADGLREAAAKAAGSPKVFGVCNLRFHPGPAALKSHLGKIGEPLFCRAYFGSYLPAMRPNRDYRDVYAAHYDQGGGIVLDTIHELDLVAWLLGPITRVGGASARLSDLEMDVEDYAEIHLAHKCGARSQVHMDYLQRYKTRGCEIIGTEGTLNWRSIGKRPEQMHVEFLSATGERTLVATQDAVDPSQMYVELMAAFRRSIEDPGCTDLQSIDEAVDVLEAALSMRMPPENNEHWKNLGALMQ